MIIGIDGNEANVEAKVGVSVYTHELLLYFARHASASCRFIVFLRHSPRDHMPQQTHYFTYKVVSGPFLWRDIFLPLALYRIKSLRVFFSPAHYTPRVCPVPVVVTIHDLAFHFFPGEFLRKDLYKLTSWTAHAISHARTVIAVSEATRTDIISHYQIAPQKVHTVLEGWKTAEGATKESNATPDVLVQHSLKSHRYILFVGTLQPRKNVQRLIEAYAELRKTEPAYTLVIAGRKGWLHDDIFRAAQNLGNAVCFTGYVSDADLADLYRHAAVFILPSLYEGFGIPVLEAMHYGCPVIVSHTPALLEIGGDACVSCNPNDIMSIRNALAQVIRSPKLQEELRAKGKKRVRAFSWEKAGQQTLDILKKSI